MKVLVIGWTLPLGLARGGIGVSRERMSMSFVAFQNVVGGQKPKITA